MDVQVRYEDKDELLTIRTVIGRLNEIKGDIKIRNEIIREIFHNGIDAKADYFDITIKYINNQQVKIIIEYEGLELKPFEDVESIVRALLEADESIKRMDTQQIGGKGRGLKVLLCAGRISIESILNNSYYGIEIDNPNKQIEEIYRGNRSTFIINAVKGNLDEDNNNYKKIKFEIDKVDTDDIRNFEHMSLIKYMRYFTVLTRIKNKYNLQEDLCVNVKGLIKSDNIYITKKQKEQIKIGSIFDELKEYAINNKCNFSFIKCSNGEIECSNGNTKNSELINECLSIEESEILRDFFCKNECYIFRTKDKKLKTFMKANHNDKDREFFGIYIGCEGVMINEKFINLSTSNGGINSGGNLYSQYFGYIYSNELRSAGDRNHIEGTTQYYLFKEKINKQVISIINKVLSYNITNTLKKTIQKDDMLYGVDPNIIQGLWAELRYICENPNKIECWTSYLQENGIKRPHDFEYEDKFIEIKSKILNRNNEPNLIKISSISQLDDVREGNLFVYFLNRYECTANIGMDIVELIGKVLNNINEEQAKNLFKGISNYLKISEFERYYENILLKSNKYKRGLYKYDISKVEVYKVDNKFPALKYRILEEACAMICEYQLDLDKVQARGYNPQIL